MNRNILAVLFLVTCVFLSCSIANAAIWYVKTDGTDPGDCTGGQSWETAYETIEKAVYCASAGDEIWVKQGTYGFPSSSIMVDLDVGIYGGFAGDELSRSERNWETNNTTLDCQNSGRYFFVSGNAAVIDGFTITNGSHSMGGGAMVLASDGTVANCTFTNNSSSSNGGAISISSSCSPTATNCTFTGNSAASGSGGAIYITITVGTATITGCTFSSGNSANNGGAIGTLTSDIDISDCTFSGNTSTINGGAIENNHSTGVISNCTFTNNTASGFNYGGGICNINNTTVTISDCTFEGNTAHDGAGIYNGTGCDTSITACDFFGNTADTETNSSGAGIYNAGSDSLTTSPTITNCLFAGNSSNYVGGGIMNYNHADAVITNCTFAGNTSPGNGTITNTNSDPTITNCILWDNAGDEIHDITNAFPVISYCDIDQDGYAGSDNNIRSDPLLRDVTDPDPANWDLHLRRNSPCIDTGSNSASGIPATDFEGDDRIIDGNRDGTPMADMGADEYMPTGSNAPLFLLLFD